MARFFDRPNAFLSEGEAHAAVVEDFPETVHQTRDNTDFARPPRKSEARLRLACPRGKAQMKTWTQVVMLSLALPAGLRTWLSSWPAPGEVALLDLVRETVMPAGLGLPDRQRNYSGPSGAFSTAC